MTTTATSKRPITADSYRFVRNVLLHEIAIRKNGCHEGGIGHNYRSNRQALARLRAAYYAQSQSVVWSEFGTVQQATRLPSGRVVGQHRIK